MTARITLPAPCGGDEMAMILRHALQMAERVMVDYDEVTRRLHVDLDDLRTKPADVEPEAPAWTLGPGPATLSRSVTLHAEPTAPAPAPKAKATGKQGITNGHGTTKRLILGHLLDHGEVTDPDGNAVDALYDAIGLGDAGNSSRQKHLAEMVAAGLIAVERPHPKRTTRIAATEDAETARRNLTGPFAPSAREALVADLTDHGPVVARNGTAVTALFARAGIERTGRQERTRLVNELVDAGLVVRRSKATKTYGVALVADAEALDALLAEPTPKPEPDVLTPPTPIRKRRDTSPKVEGRPARKAEPPAPAPVSHQGYRVIETLEDDGDDTGPAISDDERRERAVNGVFPQDFLA